MPELKNETPVNLVVEHENGEVDMIPKNRTNRLLFDHDLWGLLRDGTEIWESNGLEHEPSVRVIPNDDATQYTMEIEGVGDLTYGEHKKSDLVDVLFEFCEQTQVDGADRTNQVFIEEYDDVKGHMVRDRVIETFAEVPLIADRIEVTDQGWLFFDYLLLTWEGELYHPNTQNRKRSGGVIPAETAGEAYDISISEPGQYMTREVEIDGFTQRLTDSEMLFLAKAMWALESAPRTPNRNDDADLEGTPGLESDDAAEEEEASA